MNPTRTFLPLLLFLLPVGKMAGQTDDYPMKFGHVPPSELAMTVYAPDTSAAAVVLCDYGEAKVEQFPDGAKFKGAYQRRIKILKRPGFDYGDVSISFYTHNNTEQFYFGKGMVHLPNGEKVEIDKKDVFIEEKNKYWSRANFAFPRLEEGCIIEYTYYINSDRIHELTDWFFQEKIPVKHSELRIDFPDRFAYSYLFQGNEGMAKTADDGKGTVTYSGKNGTFVLTDRRFIMQNAPAMPAEAYISTMDDYRARVRFQLAEVIYSDGHRDKIMDTWETAKKDLDHHPYFGEQYLKKSSYKKLVEAVLPQAKNLATPAEKVRFFYQYIAENMTWNGNHAMATRAEKLDDIFATQKGSSGELNLMLLVLLREAGIGAWPLITSTRSNGRMYENYPLIDQFDHVMVYTVLDSVPTLLDATDPLRPMGYPGVDALNSRGVLIKDKEDPLWMDITPPKNAVDAFVFELSLNEEGSLDGTVAGAYKGYNAIPERRRHQDEKAVEAWQERLTGKFPEVKVSGLRCGNLDKLEEAFFDSLEVSLPGAAQVAGEFIYLPPVLHSEFSENPFKKPERLYPVNFPYPFTEQYILKLRLPEGYQVEELPKNARVSLQNNAAFFHFGCEEKTPGEIQVTSRLVVNRLVFYPDEYAALKELFDLLVEKCGEQIVLRKV